jgi:hypothetical protein
LLVTLVLATPALAQAQAPQEVVIKGDPAKRWIENDDLGFYYQIPADRRLRAEVDGPGTLVLYLVNHRAEGAKAASTLLVTRDDQPWKRLRLGCGPTKRRFTAGSVRPCARLTRDLQIPAGKQKLGFRLSKTRWGASAQFEFVAQAALDAEPDLVTSMDTKTEPDAVSAEWQPADDIELAAIPSKPPGPPSAASATAPGPTELETTAAGSGVSSGPWTLALAAVAVAAAGAGTYFGLRSKAKFNDAEETYVQLDKKELNASGRTSALVADILFGVAGLSAGTAAIAFFAAPREAASDAEGSSSVGLRLGFDL